MIFKSNARCLHFETIWKTRPFRASRTSRHFENPPGCASWWCVGECKIVLSLWRDGNGLERNSPHCSALQRSADDDNCFLRSRMEEFTLGKYVHHQVLKRKGQFLFMTTIWWTPSNRNYKPTAAAWSRDSLETTNMSENVPTFPFLFIKTLPTWGIWKNTGIGKIQGNKGRQEASIPWEKPGLCILRQGVLLYCLPTVVL